MASVDKASRKKAPKSVASLPETGRKVVKGTKKVRKAQLSSKETDSIWAAALKKNKKASRRKGAHPNVGKSSRAAEEPGPRPPRMSPKNKKKPTKPDASSLDFKPSSSTLLAIAAEDCAYAKLAAKKDSRVNARKQCQEADEAALNRCYRKWKTAKS